MRKMFIRILLVILITLLMTGSAISETKSHKHPASYLNENPDNIVFTEVNWETVKLNRSANIEFHNNNIITNIKFWGLEYAGQVATRVILISNTSSIVDSPPDSELYHYVGINVGNFNWIKKNPIDRKYIDFKVNKNWIANENINKSTIILFRHKPQETIFDLQGNIIEFNITKTGDKWTSLTTKLIDEDAEYLYFESQTPYFDSVFAISAKKIIKIEPIKKTQEPVRDFNYTMGTDTKAISKGTAQTPLIEIKPSKDLGLFGFVLFVSFDILVLFSSSYLLILAMFPGKEDLNGLRRVVFSTVITIAVGSIFVLIPNYTSWDIKQVQILAVLSGFCMVSSFVAYNRRSKLPEIERFSFSFEDLKDILKHEAFYQTINQIILPVLAICVGEILIFLGYPIYGLAVHMVNLLLLIFLIIGGEHLFDFYKNDTINPIFQSFILILLLRIVNMATPIFFIPSIFWISIIYGIMFLPLYLVIKQQNFTLKEIGLQFDESNIYYLSYVPLVLFVGSVLALIEFWVIRPEPMIDNLSIPNIIVIVLIMFFFVGAVEELIFRSILQTRLEQSFGLRKGLIITSILFGIMHSGYGTVYEIFFASVVALFIGFLFQKTRNLPFVVGIHGTINVFVFGILPLIIK